MAPFLAPFLAAFALSAGLVPIVRRFAIAKKLFDWPEPRKIHDQPTARLGGVAVFAAFWLVIWTTFFAAPGKLHFSDWKIAGVDANLLGVFLASVLLFAVGLIDDIRPLPPLPKFLTQLAAGGLLAAFGIRIWWLSNPLGGANIVLEPWQSHALIILWVVLLTNAINWLDGLDGLAAGVTAIAAIVLFLLSLAPFVNQPHTALLAAALAGSALGFLPANFHPARIFLGDAGSMTFGFLLATLSVISGAKLATAALVLGVAITDAFFVIIRRLAAARPPWLPDRRHLHHRFLAAGFGHRESVLFFWIIAAAFGAVALASKTREKLIAATVLFGLVFILALILVWLERRRAASLKP